MSRCQRGVDFKCQQSQILLQMSFQRERVNRDTRALRNNFHSKCFRSSEQKITSDLLRVEMKRVVNQRRVG